MRRTAGFGEGYPAFIPDGDLRGPRPAMYAATGGRERLRIVVGDDGVLVTLWSTEMVPSSWLGTPR